MSWDLSLWRQHHTSLQFNATYIYIRPGIHMHMGPLTLTYNMERDAHSESCPRERGFAKPGSGAVVATLKAGTDCNLILVLK